MVVPCCGITATSAVQPRLWREALGSPPRTNTLCGFFSFPHAGPSAAVGETRSISKVGSVHGEEATNSKKESGEGSSRVAELEKGGNSRL